MSSIISAVVAIIVISALLYFLMKQKAGGKRKFNPKAMDNGSPKQSSGGGLNTDLVKQKWVEITAMQSQGPSGLKNALSEADKLLDYVMIQRGFKGETMGDRLKSGGNAFSNLNAIWGAHKLRNQLAHEVEHDMVPEQIKHAITVLGQGIRDLGVSL